MKAIPASTKWCSRIRTAAIRLPTRPVIEIAFGVSRDSIRRLRASSRISAAVRMLMLVAVRHAQASGRARANAA